MRIAIVGRGKMGRAVAEAAREEGHEVLVTIDSAGNRDGAAITSEAMSGADVAIEFSTPEAAVPNLERLIDVGVPVVVGTTGWYDRLEEVRAMVEARRGAVVYGANFSPGVQVLLRLATEAARLLSGLEEYDAVIEETHHRGKRDAPSGTALVLGERTRAADQDRLYPITSVRLGHVPGTHRLAYDARYESIALEHRVRDRRIFATGALQAARWIVGRTGFFDFTRVLFDDGSEPVTG